MNASTSPTVATVAATVAATFGQRVGYLRVSSMEQNTARQLHDGGVAATGERVNRSFTDTLSGKDTARPALTEMLAYVRDGDTVVVHSMDRLARNLDDLRKIVRDLTGRGVRVEFVKESLTFTGDDSPMSQLLLSVMGAFSEFERSLIRERQREGIALAKGRGVYRGRKKALGSEQIDAAREKLANGTSKAQIARDFGVSRETIYKALRDTANS